MTSVPKPGYVPDSVDLELIKGLRRDGRAPVTELGALVGLGEDATRERLRRLLDRGVVSVVGIVDPTLLGYTRFALVGLNVTGRTAAVLDELVRIEHIDFCAVVGGRFDVIAEVVCRDDEHLAEVVGERIRALPGVSSSITMDYLQVAKWAPDKVISATSDSAERHVVLDGVDVRLLTELQRDGRLSFQELARRTGVTSSLARRRTLSLIAGGVIRISTVVDRGVTDAQVLAGVGLRIDGPVSSVLDRVQEIPQIEIAAVVAGPFDVILEVSCSSRGELADLVGNQLRSRTGVRSTETWPYLRIVRLPANWDFASGFGGIR